MSPYTNPEDQKAASRLHYQRNREHVKARTRDRNQALRALKREILLASKDRACMDCGKQYPPPVMEFDHISGPKIGNISTMAGNNNHSPEQLIAEIEKTEVVCNLCHRLRHYHAGDLGQHT